MTEDSFSKISEESMASSSSTASAVRQRKKRKWDQPAEVLISSAAGGGGGGGFGGGVLPLSNNRGTVVGITLPGVANSMMPATSTAMPQVFQAPSIQQNTAAVVQKLIQPKIQDELIAREIIINDAESTVRYKLTKRLTQEEIQRCTGAVVITRGKYRPPNVLTDTDKPLYLHISAGAHLKETAERIIAVDRAAAMVEEMLKPGVSSHPASTTTHSAVGNGGQFAQPLDACVFLGFDTDPSLNIAARIRGPNDQYINHIMNETGATVLLRGRGSGNFETPQREELQQSLHLYLSSNNPKSLEDAKLLAENLLDTISVECGVSRVTSSNKVYNAVPPPRQLLAGVQRSGNVLNENAGPVGSASSTMGSTPPAQVFPATVPGVSSIYPQGIVGHGGLFSYSQPSTSMVSYPQSSVSNGTSYSGYGGIYPQATPLQQVALALRQSPSPITVGTPPAASAGIPLPKPNLYTITESEKRLPHRRKFQELPVVAKGSAKPCQDGMLDLAFQNSLQGSEFVKPGESSEDSVVRNVSTMPPPKKLVQSSSNGMPPPSRTMPPPPPPKFNSPTPSSKANAENSKLTKSISEAVPDTLIKLMEYGEEDEDEDLEDNGLESPKIDSKPMAAPKPFWAL